MSKELIKKLSGRGGIKYLALYYLSRHTEETVPLRDISEWIPCHPCSVSNALDPLLGNQYFRDCLEKHSIRNMSTYLAKNRGSMASLKKAFDLLDLELSTGRYGVMTILKMFYDVLENEFSGKSNNYN